MRILDRYVLASFVVDFVVVAFLIVGLVTLGHTALNFDEFLEEGSFIQVLRRLARFATSMPPVLFVSLAPILTLAAAMLTLSSFSRTRELAAMRACGISPGRIAAPIFGAAFLVSLVMFGCAELYLPSHSGQILESLALGKGKGDEMLRQLVVDGEGNVFFFERFSPGDGVFENAWIDWRVREGDGWRRGRTVAASGRWIRGRDRASQLLLEDCEIYTESRRGSAPELRSEMVFATDLLPIDVEEPGARLQFQSLAELRRLAGTNSNQRHRLLLQINGRIAHYLFSGWVLLLIALPLSLGMSERSKWSGMLITIVVIAVYMFVQQTCTSLGERGQIPPALAAWFPVALFGSVGVCMFANTQG